jgi:integrase
MISRRPAATKTRCSLFEVADAQVLDASPEDIIAGLRDRAILSVGLQVGRRRAEIAALKVGDLHRDPLAINPQTATRIRTISSLLYADRLN